jgi:signal transduction histidine kinase
MTISAKVSAPGIPAPLAAAEVKTVDLRSMTVRYTERAQVSRQISHDIDHEVGTIKLLASLLASSPDLDRTSRERARQILGETRWLQQLQRAYEDNAVNLHSGRGAREPVRLDLLADEVVSAMQLSTMVHISLTVEEVWAHVDRLAFWRAMRNLVGNAVRAAGPDGRVEVRVTVSGGWATLEVEDDGPGFGAVPAGTASLGLDIVMNLATTWAGQLEIRRGVLGGCSVRMRLLAVAPADGGVADGGN